MSYVFQREFRKKQSWTIINEISKAYDTKVMGWTKYLFMFFRKILWTFGQPTTLQLSWYLFTLIYKKKKKRGKRSACPHKIMWQFKITSQDYSRSREDVHAWSKEIKQFLKKAKNIIGYQFWEVKKTVYTSFSFYVWIYMLIKR